MNKDTLETLFEMAVDGLISIIAFVAIISSFYYVFTLIM